MIQPIKRDEEFLNEVRSVRDQVDLFHLWWLGQSGFLLKWNGRTFVFDPYLSDSLTAKYAESDRPHVRMTERIVDPIELNFVDVVTSSHNHTDHLDAETLRPIWTVSPQMRLIVPEANRNFVAERLGIHRALPLGLDDGESLDIAGFTITGVAAAHESFEMDDEGRHKYLGYIVQFGDFTLFHSGDTVLYDGLAQRLESFDVDVAILPINGSDPARGVAGNMSGIEAAELAAQIGAGLVIPCHFDMFEFNTASPDSFESRCQELGQAYRVLEAGEEWSSRELAAARMNSG